MSIDNILCKISLKLYIEWQANICVVLISELRGLSYKTESLVLQMQSLKLQLQDALQEDSFAEETASALYPPKYVIFPS